MMLAKMSIFLGEIISGDQGKLPHCPRVWSDLGRASSKSPALQSPPAARPCRWILPEERGREPPDPSFRVTCPLKCHGAHQLYEAPLFLVSYPTKKYSTAMCSLVPCTPFLEKVQNDTSFTLDVEDNADQESATLGDSLLSRTSTT